MDSEKIIRDLSHEDRAGCRLEPVEYTPRAIPGKSSNPTYQDQPCQGIRLHLDDPAAVRPFRLVYALLLAMQKHHKKQLEWKPFFDTLAGGDGVRNAIQSGTSSASYLKSIEADLLRFEEARPKRYQK
jgi:uncharacterized protein YbbC (DUF1343 family)